MSTITAPRPRVNAKSRPLTVTLTMEINGAAYRVELIANAPGALKSYRLAKAGGDAAVYDVNAFADRVVCTCLSYTKTHEGTSSLCKHGRALVMVGLVDHPAEAAAPAFVHVADEFDEPGRAAYDTAREQLAAIAEAEAAVRSEAEAPAPVVKAPIHPTTYDPQWQAALAAVSKGAAIWIDHRHLHTSDPLPTPKAAVEAGPACCPDDEVLPCTACVAHEGPADLSDTDGWDDDHVWSTSDFAPDPDDDDGPWWTDPVDPRTWDPSLDAEDDGPDARSLAEQVDGHARALRAVGSPLHDLLAERAEQLAEQIRFLGASTVEQYRDRLQAMLDVTRDAAEARMASRCC
jgi:hypothetical protein